jgi:hypothetical protein
MSCLSFELVDMVGEMLLLMASSVDDVCSDLIFRRVIS